MSGALNGTDPLRYSNTHSSSLYELLDDVSPPEHGELPQDVAHHPDGDAVEQPDALIDARGILCRLGQVCIDTELSELEEGGREGGRGTRGREGGGKGGREGGMEGGGKGGGITHEVTWTLQIHLI